MYSVVPVFACLLVLLIVGYFVLQKKGMRHFVEVAGQFDWSSFKIDFGLLLG